MYGPLRYEASRKAAARDVASIRRGLVQERAELDSKASEQSSHMNRANELSNRYVFQVINMSNANTTSL